MELNITCRFMSIEEKKLPDATLHMLTVFNGKPTTLYLADNNNYVEDFYDMSFGESVTMKVKFVEHPKVQNAYKMKFVSLV